MSNTNAADDDWFNTPRLVQLATIVNNSIENRLVLDEHAWRKCLQNEHVRHLPVCVVLATGAALHHNVSLIHYIHSYIEARAHSDPADVVAEFEQPQQQTCSPHPPLTPKTSGNNKQDDEEPITMLAWSRPLILKCDGDASLPDQQRRYAVLFVACNGEWDERLAVEKNAAKTKMFSFCTVIGNIVCVDVKYGIGFSHRLKELLDFFHLCSEKFTLMNLQGDNNNKKKLLQSGIVVVSNWRRNEELSFGLHDAGEIDKICEEPSLSFGDCFDSSKICLFPNHYGAYRVVGKYADELSDYVRQSICPKLVGSKEVCCSDLARLAVDYSWLVNRENGAMPDVGELIALINRPL